jgi:Ca2+-binding EF-hand superfamily protein
MVSSIGGSSMAIMNRPDPKELFNRMDSDGSGSISKNELQAFDDDMAKKTGKSQDIDTAFGTYDTDSDGALTTGELNSLLQSFAPSGAGRAEMGPPPPPPQNDVTTAYAENSGEDGLSSLVAQLQSLLQQLTSSEDSSALTGNSVSGGSGGFFGKVDTDGSGGVSQSELQAIAETMQETTGGSIDTSDEAFATYDTDADGSLSDDELKVVMEASRSTAGANRIGPPPPEMTASSSSYSSEDLNDQVSALKELLERLSSFASTTGDSQSLLNVTT